LPHSPCLADRQYKSTVADPREERVMQGLGATKSRLQHLLRYTDELLSVNDKITFNLAREPYPHFHVSAEELSWSGKG